MTKNVLDEKTPPKIEEIKIEEDFHTKYMRERKEKADNFPKKAERFKKKLKELKVKSFSVEYSGSGDSGEIHEISYEPKKLNASIDVGTWKRWNMKTFEMSKQLTINLCVIILKTFVMTYLQTIMVVGKLTRVKVVVLIGTQKMMLLNHNIHSIH